MAGRAVYTKLADKIGAETAKSYLYGDRDIAKLSKETKSSMGSTMKFLAELFPDKAKYYNSLSKRYK